MKIVIIGAGFTGTQLARKLINEKNDVVLIDNDEETVRHASNRLDCTVIQTDGNSLQNLEEAGIAKADALVAVTDNDEINMITCSLVDAVYPDLLKIARVRNYAYYVNTARAARHHAETFAKNHRPLYGIDYMIHPDVEAAEAIATAVEHGAVSDVVAFGDGEYELCRLTVEQGCQMDGIQLKNIRTLTDKKLIVVYLEKEDGASLPSGDTVIHAGDALGVLAGKKDLPSVMELCGTKLDAMRKVALVGAGRIGTIVAERLIERKKTSVFAKLFNRSQRKVAQDFLIVDNDESLCREISESFPEARVCCADVTDEGFIEEEGLDKFNLVICATHNHELNMVVSAYLESLGVQKTVALVSHAAFGDIARKLGVDVPIPLRDTVVDSIMSHLRGKHVTGIHSVNGEFEIVECDLPSKSPIIGQTLKDIANPGAYLLMLIKKPGSATYDLPGGNTTFSAGDHLVLIAKTEKRKVLEQFGAE